MTAGKKFAIALALAIPAVVVGSGLAIAAANQETGVDGNQGFAAEAKGRNVSTGEFVPSGCGDCPGWGSRECSGDCEREAARDCSGYGLCTGASGCEGFGQCNDAEYVSTTARCVPSGGCGNRAAPDGYVACDKLENGACNCDPVGCGAGCGGCAGSRGLAV